MAIALIGKRHLYYHAVLRDEWKLLVRVPFKGTKENARSIDLDITSDVGKYPFDCERLSYGLDQHGHKAVGKEWVYCCINSKNLLLLETPHIKSDLEDIEEAEREDQQDD